MKKPKFKAPFRVGRKQKRCVLDANGLVVVIFPDGCEDMAEEYCMFLNAKEFNAIVRTSKTILFNG